ncbi:hypothetical protein L345_15478, partial [Ophiophagus hannah]
VGRKEAREGGREEGKKEKRKEREGGRERRVADQKITKWDPMTLLYHPEVGNYFMMQDILDVLHKWMNQSYLLLQIFSVRGLGYLLQHPLEVRHGVQEVTGFPGSSKGDLTLWEVHKAGRDRRSRRRQLPERGRTQLEWYLKDPLEDRLSWRTSESRTRSKGWELIKERINLR